MSAFLLQGQSRVVSGLDGLQSLSYLHSGPFQKKLADPCSKLVSTHGSSGAPLAPLSYPHLEARADLGTLVSAGHWLSPTLGVEGEGH